MKVPGFYLNSFQENGGWCGTLVTIVLLVLLISYGSVKLAALVERKNPSISTNENLGAIGDSIQVNLNRSGLRFAFTAENWDSETVTDPRYVRFIVMVTGCFGEDCTERPISFHKCSEMELRDLAPPAQDAAPLLEEIIASDKRSLYCIDWDKHGDHLTIFGSPSSYNYQYISVILAPCNFVYPGKEEFYPIADECIADEDAQREYLKSFDMKLYAEEQIFI